MRRELFADKLAAGTAEASAIASWWPMHNCSLSEYIKASSNDDLKKAHEYCINLARTWDALLGPRQDCMREHVRCEFRLIKAALIADQEGMHQAAEGLGRNIKDQTEVLCDLRPGFPAVSFGVLMHGHIGLLMDWLVYFTEKNFRKTAGCTRVRKQNAVALGALMTEWI